MREFNVLMVGLALAATITGQSYATVPPDEFVNQAAVMAAFELHSSQLALDKSPNPTVKKFAQEMLDNYTKIVVQLREANAVSHVVFIPDPVKMDGKYQGFMKTLKRDSVREFNIDYAKDQKNTHKRAIKLFTYYSEKGTDPALKSFATKTLPILGQSLSHAKLMKPTLVVKPVS